MDMILLGRIALFVAALCCLGCIVRGMLLIQRAGGGETLACRAVVRQVQRDGFLAVKALLTLTVEESALHVACRLPGEWLHRVRIAPTDILPVLWHRGDTEAIAKRTIRYGQTLLVIGAVGLGLLVLLALKMV